MRAAFGRAHPVSRPLAAGGVPPVPRVPRALCRRVAPRGLGGGPASRLAARVAHTDRAGSSSSSDSSSGGAALTVTTAWRAATAGEEALDTQRPTELVGALWVLAEAAAAGGAEGEEFLSDLLLSSTWLLSLRAAAAAKLGSFGAPRLAAFISALGQLPLHAEISPLPIGFGTPRWALPRAVADTEKWEAFLCAASDAFVEALSDLLDTAGPRAAPGAQPAPQPAQAQAQALVASFARGLAASNKWAMARVDADWVGCQECEARVVSFVSERWPALEAQLAAIDAACGLGPGGAGGGGAGGGASYSRRDRLRRRALAGFLVRAQLQHRMSPPATMLEAFFDAAAPPAPPAPPARGSGGGGARAGPHADADSIGAGGADLYSLEDLESIVRTLMLIGSSPSEPWLRGLVDVVVARRGEMGPQQLRGFVEGFRFFRTQHGGNKHLRDGIGLLSEWL